MEACTSLQIISLSVCYLLYILIGKESCKYSEYRIHRYAHCYYYISMLCWAPHGFILCLHSPHSWAYCRILYWLWLWLLSMPKHLTVERVCISYYGNGLFQYRWKIQCRMAYLHSFAANGYLFCHVFAYCFAEWIKEKDKKRLRFSERSCW